MNTRSDSATNRPVLAIEPMGQSGGHCDCCGTESGTAWGMVHDGESYLAAYYLHWTVGAPLEEHPVNIDLILGPWGEGTRREDRVAVSTIHFTQDGRPGVMVTDATDRSQLVESALAGRALRRTEVVGTVLAGQVFALVDAVIVGANGPP